MVLSRRAQINLLRVSTLKVVGTNGKTVGTLKISARRILMLATWPNVVLSPVARAVRLRSVTQIQPARRVPRATAATARGTRRRAARASTRKMVHANFAAPRICGRVPPAPSAAHRTIGQGGENRPMPRRARGGTSRVQGPRHPRAPALVGAASGAQRQTNGVKRAPLEVTRAARLPRTQLATRAQAGPLATDRGPKQPARTGRIRRRRVAAFRAVLATSTPRGRRTLHAAHAATGASRAATRPKTRRVRRALPVPAATGLGLNLVAALGNTPAASVHRRVNCAPALV